MSERRSVAGELPDGIVPAGQEQNPNPPAEVAAQRARFAERQQELQAGRREAEDVVEVHQAQVEAQYRDAQGDPAHQVVRPEQLAHGEHDALREGGGHESTSPVVHPEVASPLAAPLLGAGHDPASVAPTGATSQPDGSRPA